MLFLKQASGDAVTWRVLPSDDERVVQHASAGAWSIWCIGAVPAQVAKEVSGGIANGEVPARVLTEVRERHEGSYALIALNEADDHLVAVSDPYAIVKMYAAHGSQGMVLGTQLFEVAAEAGTGDCDAAALAYLFTTGYTPSRHTLWSNVEKLAPGTVVEWRKGERSEHEYLDIFPTQQQLQADEYLERFDRRWTELLKPWIERYEHHYVALSGGIDSTLLLAFLLRAGMAPEQCVATSMRFVASQRYDDNEVDIEYARAVAQHFGVRHELIEYDLGNSEVLDDFQRWVRVLGSDSNYGFGFFRTFSYGAGANSAAYCGQNADSVLSFGSLGHPFFSWRPFGVRALGGWCNRFALFGGFHDGRWHWERPIVGRMLREYMRRRSGVAPQLTLEEVLLGAGMEPSNWPFVATDTSFAKLADPGALAQWFCEHYLTEHRLTQAAENPHAAALWLYVQTYMQGSANRATMWGGLAAGMNTFLPFTDVELLRATARVRPDSRFYWHGKYPNVHMARKLRGFPRFVLKRKDGADSMQLFLSDFVRNRRVHEYVRSLLETFDPQRLAGVLKPAYCSRKYWNEQLKAYEGADFRRMEGKVLPVLLWVLSLEEHVRNYRRPQIGHDAAVVA